MSTVYNVCDEYDSDADEDYVPSPGSDDDAPGLGVKANKKKRKTSAANFSVGAAVLSDDEEDELALKTEQRLRELAADPMQASSKKEEVNSLWAELNEDETKPKPKSTLASSVKPKDSASDILQRLNKSKKPLTGVKRKVGVKKVKKTINPWELPDKTSTQINTKKVANKAKGGGLDLDGLLAGPRVGDLDTESKKEKKTVEEGTGTQHKCANRTSTISTAVESTSKGNAAAKAYQDPNVLRVKEVKEYAGKKIEVTREIVKGSKEAKKIKSMDNLDYLVASLKGGPKKLTTLEKSQMDWDVSKKEEGDEDELKAFTQSKDSFLSKQKFLSDTDMRQFEREKSARDAQRAIRSLQEKKAAQK